MTLGGRAAEELVFGEVTTGASNDLEKVTATAKQMVMRFGMSEKLGPRVFGHDHGQPFLGREFSSEPDYSDDVAREIDGEIRRIVEEAHQLARDDPRRSTASSSTTPPRSCCAARRSSARSSSSCSTARPRTRSSGPTSRCCRRRPPPAPEAAASASPSASRAAAAARPRRRLGRHVAAATGVPEKPGRVLS